MSSYRFYVYEILENGVPVYVGKGTGDRMHVHGYGGHNPVVEAIIARAKYTGARIERIKIEDDLSEDEAFALEAVWIKRIGRLDKGRGPLLNKSDGWEGWSSARNPPPPPPPPRESKRPIMGDPEKAKVVPGADWTSPLPTSLPPPKFVDSLVAFAMWLVLAAVYFGFGWWMIH